MSQGSVVTFRCVGDASVDNFTWQTGGLPHYVNKTTCRESGLIFSNLSMIVHYGYNQSTVSCTALCDSEFCGKSMAVLEVLGKEE